MRAPGWGLEVSSSEQSAPSMRMKSIFYLNIPTLAAPSYQRLIHIGANLEKLHQGLF